MGIANGLNGGGPVLSASSVLATVSGGTLTRLTLDFTDASGTPGNVTINKPTGQVAMAALSGSLTVTNSMVTTSSVVIVVLQDTTDLSYIRGVVPAAGSFTIVMSGAVTAPRKIGFLVI